MIAEPTVVYSLARLERLARASQSQRSTTLGPFIQYLSQIYSILLCTYDARDGTTPTMAHTCRQ